MEIRTPQRTLEKLAELRREKNPLKALAAAVEVMEKYPRYEGKKAVRYCERTGRPLEFKWVPEQKYAPQVDVEWDYEHKRYIPRDDREQIALHQDVLDFLLVKNKLEEQNLEFQARGQDYALAFEKHSYTAHCHNDTWNQVDYMILFKPVKKIKLGGKK